jgi:mannose-binding lectin 2
MFLLANADEVKDKLVGTSVLESRGYLRREHSLAKPYQGAGMEIPYWNIIGSTMVSSQQIRLTPDLQSRKGAIWNSVPCYSRDWELHVVFQVHGATGTLFGDGMALWYVQEPNVIGDVFGSKDNFRGLAIFLDTYSNHNGPHSHSHPYISAMVSNGTLAYDHDRDGTHTQLGGEHTGCEAKFRNKEHDTQMLIRYVGDTLSIFTDVSGAGTWKECMSVAGVHLPTGMYFGISAATGDLSDNHDIVAVRMYEQEYARAERFGEVNHAQIEPSADNVAAPRDHVDAPRPSKLGWIGTTLLVIIGIVVIVLGLGFGVLFLQKRQERSRKRFY